MLFENFINRSIIEKAFLENGFTHTEVDSIKEKGYFDMVEFHNETEIKIYRNITILNTEIEEFEKTYFNNDIGVYWSLSSDTRAIWGDRGDGLDNQRIEYQCIGLLDISNIDWKMMRYVFDTDFNYLVDEYEIRAEKNNIDIIKCYRD
jgi:hypothetical protein